MHLLNLPEKHAIAHHVVIEFVQVSDCRKSRTRKPAERMEVETIERFGHNKSDNQTQWSPETQMLHIADVEVSRYDGHWGNLKSNDGKVKCHC